MDKPVLTTKQQTETPKRKPFGVFVLVALAAAIFMVIGGLVYGINKISEFTQQVESRIKQDNFPLIDDDNPDNFFKINANKTNRNINQPATNQAPVNSSAGAPNDCLDSDASLLTRDIYASGVTTLTSIGGQSVTTAYDSCRDNVTVEEVKCWKGTNGANSYTLQRIPYLCPKGCINGACKE